MRLPFSWLGVVLPCFSGRSWGLMEQSCGAMFSSKQLGFFYGVRIFPFGVARWQCIVFPFSHASELAASFAFAKKHLLSHFDCCLGMWCSSLLARIHLKSMQVFLWPFFHRNSSLNVFECLLNLCLLVTSLHPQSSEANHIRDILLVGATCAWTSLTFIFFLCLILQHRAMFLLVVSALGPWHCCSMDGALMVGRSLSLFSYLISVRQFCCGVG